MSSASPAQQIIESALALTAEDRLAVIDALHVSLADPSIDHGPVEDADEVSAAWGAEIARRVAAIKSGRVKTIPAEEAEQMIRGHGRPSF